MGLLYRPRDGFVGDVIPFYWQGMFHAFYLKAPLPPARHGADGTPYAHLVSRDLVSWEEWPLAIEPGGPGAPDALSCWTGSVIERDGVFSLFYTGFPGAGQPQTVCRATSTDLQTWHKDPTNPILRADERWYEPVDWRDPFPFWNEEAGEYWMLLAARERTGPANRRGCVALAASQDLQHWEVRPPFWSPRLWYTHECPDLFRWNDYWVLVFSTFSERTVTHYRISRSLAGPWHAPSNDTFDTRAFYAAKTASDGARRFVFGWNPTREGETDTGRWEWGGHLVAHELAQHTDGSLTVRPIEQLLAHISSPTPLSFRSQIGEWRADTSSFSAAPGDGFSACTLGELPETCRVRLSLSAGPATRSLGVLLRCDASLERYYQLRWEPAARRVVLDRWPRPGDEPFLAERPVTAAPDAPLSLDIVLDGSAMIAYLDGEAALSWRGYDHRAGLLGLFAVDGEAHFGDVAITTLHDSEHNNQ